MSEDEKCKLKCMKMLGLKDGKMLQNKLNKNYFYLRNYVA